VINAATGEQDTKPIHYFSIDTEYVYWNFFLDFGPLNLGHLYRYCQKLNDKLVDPGLRDYIIVYYSSAAPTKRTNAAYLICAWQILYLHLTPEDAFSGFKKGPRSPHSVIEGVSSSDSNIYTLQPFHDASPCECTYNLTVLDCLRGLAKARDYGFFNFETFDVNEYEYYEQVEVRFYLVLCIGVWYCILRCVPLAILTLIDFVSCLSSQNGDLNWIIKDKILAFAGPHYRRNITAEGYCTLTPHDYIKYFQQKNVGLVVRLNKKCYDENDFIQAGIDHFEQYYLDGSCPPMSILHKVVAAFEANDERGFAVHCKAGLGRTGTCIGAYIMKHYRLTAAEVIGWMRICRPGMVIGPQQHFLADIEQRMWHEGSVMSNRPGRGIFASVKERLGRDSKGLNYDKYSQGGAARTKLAIGDDNEEEGGVAQRKEEEICGQGDSLRARRVEAKRQSQQR